MLLITSCLGKAYQSADVTRICYQPLVDCVPDKMMDNTIGFENNKCYKVRNRADNTVIEFMLGSSNKMISGQEVTAGENSHQIFEAIEEDTGEFRIACKYQSAEAQHVWDFLQHRKVLIHKKRTTAESSLQLWQSQAVSGANTAFFIISVQGGLCLKSNGKNKQVTLAQVNEEDPTQQWRLEPQPI